MNNLLKELKETYKVVYDKSMIGQQWFVYRTIIIRKISKNNYNITIYRKYKVYNKYVKDSDHNLYIHKYNKNFNRESIKTIHEVNKEKKWFYTFSNKLSVPFKFCPKCYYANNITGWKYDPTRNGKCLKCKYVF